MGGGRKGGAGQASTLGPARGVRCHHRPVFPIMGHTRGRVESLVLSFFIYLRQELTRSETQISDVRI